jgi:hypothetical protein
MKLDKAYTNFQLLVKLLDYFLIENKREAS